MPLVASPWSFRPRALSLFDAIAAVGLTANLELAFDFGLAATYPGSGQAVADGSGEDNDFVLGGTSSAQTDDPAFAGAAGALSANEYLAFDGGDFLTLDGTNPAAIENLHKASALCSGLACIYTPAGAEGTILGTPNSELQTSIGFAWAILASGQTWISARDGVGWPQFSTTAGLVDDAWNIVAVSIDETANGFFRLNGAAHQVGGSDTFSADYGSPSSGAATNALKMGARGDGSEVFSADMRLGALALWEGVAHSAADLDAVAALMAPRYGI